MTKEEIAQALEEIATLLELKGENPFKIRAYTNAARAIETFRGNIADFQDEAQVAQIPGIGESIALKIKELAATGSLKYLRDLRAEFPTGILELFSLPGLGAKKIKALYDKLGVSSIAQLQEACEQGRVAELPGFGETTQQKLRDAIARRAEQAGSFQLGEVAPEAETLRSDLAALDAASQVEIAGSYRRRKEVVHDLDFLVATNPDHAQLPFDADNFRQFPPARLRQARPGRSATFPLLAPLLPAGTNRLARRVWRSRRGAFAESFRQSRAVPRRAPARMPPAAARWS